MTITFLGHAGWLVDTDDCLIVMDPWLSRTGAYLQSWWQFPANDHLAPMVAGKVLTAGKPVLVYVSHEHLDHYDRRFLETLPDTVRYVTADYRHIDFAGQLGTLPCRGAAAVADGDRIRVGGTTVEMFVVDDGMEHDSAVLVRCGRASFLNLNDAKLFARLREIAPASGGGVFTCQFSGAIWHPVCYDYDDARMLEVGRAKTAARWTLIEQAIRTVKPDVYVPSAGPPAFLDPDLGHLNRLPWRAAFPRSHEIANDLRLRNIGQTAIAAIQPGDEMVVDDAGKARVAHPSRAWTDADCEHEIESQSRRHAGAFGNRRRVGNDLLDRVEKLVAAKLNRFDASSASLPEWPLYIGIEENDAELLRVDLRGRGLGRGRPGPGERCYRMLAPGWVLAELADGSVSWEEMLLSMRASMSRTPDTYVLAIHGFLINDAESMPRFSAELATALSDERIVVEAGQGRYVVDRYCPHMGGDLSDPCIEGNHVICKRHGWRFDLAAGGDAVGNEGTINANRLRRE